jgi:hypothetical protein
MFFWLGKGEIDTISDHNDPICSRSLFAQKDPTPLGKVGSRRARQKLGLKLRPALDAISGGIDRPWRESFVSDIRRSGCGMFCEFFRKPLDLRVEL